MVRNTEIDAQEKRAAQWQRAHSAGGLPQLAQGILPEPRRRRGQSRQRKFRWGSAALQSRRAL